MYRDDISGKYDSFPEDAINFKFTCFKTFRRIFDDAHVIKSYDIVDYIQSVRVIKFTDV